MKTLKPLAKKTNKYDRERKVLVGLIEHYIRTGKPVGSAALKDAGFDDLSSATIRNYFAHLEEEGYLAQQHISGGRVPTEKAFRFYIDDCLENRRDSLPPSTVQLEETRSIALMLQQAAEQLSRAAKTAVFLSPPRFEQDFITGIKIVPIDSERCLCILLTEFGEIRTETLHTEQKIGTLVAKKLENYFNARLTNQPKPALSKQEEELGQKLYNELLVRYIVGYSQFNEEEVYRTGLSTLLSYPELQDPAQLAASLSLFENSHGMRLLLKECAKFNRLKCWVGNELTPHALQKSTDCAILAIPYHVNKQPVGAIGLLGPLRLPYPDLFSLLNSFSEEVSGILTRSLYKFKISLKQPKDLALDLKIPLLIPLSSTPLLEDKRKAPPGPEGALNTKPIKQSSRRKA